MNTDFRMGYAPAVKVAATNYERKYPLGMPKRVIAEHSKAWASLCRPKDLHDFEVRDHSQPSPFLTWGDN